MRLSSGGAGIRLNGLNRILILRYVIHAAQIAIALAAVVTKGLITIVGSNIEPTNKMCSENVQSARPKL